MRTIAIVAGGNSSEYEISVKSAIQVSKLLDSEYHVYIIIIRGTSWYWEDSKGRYHNIDKNDFSLRTDEYRIRFDAVFIAIHGTPGENGLLQGYLDMLQIPYTSCSSFCSALTFNKQATKLYLKEFNIRMARSLLIRRSEKIDYNLILKEVGLPCFVKPNDSGSSYGVSKVKMVSDLEKALEKAFNESNEVLIEAYMGGREVACGVVKTHDRSLVLPVTEIITKNEFFDFEAKYTPGRSDEVTPADLPPDITGQIKDLSSRIYDILGCKGIVRVDYIITDDEPWFLEINTVPGMTGESIIPKQAEAAGIKLEELYSIVIEDLFE
jgi:D-alanine-D-alanine ligase